MWMCTQPIIEGFGPSSRTPRQELKSRAQDAFLPGTSKGEPPKRPVLSPTILLVHKPPHV